MSLMIKGLTVHAPTHEDGGDDEISIAGLLGEPAELTTHKADPDIHHPKNVLVWDDDQPKCLDTGNIVALIDWTELDLSTYVPAGSKYVYLFAQLSLVLTATTDPLAVFRKNGTTPAAGNFGIYLGSAQRPAARQTQVVFFCGLDGDYKMQYYVKPAGGTVRLQLWVMGWIEG